MITATKSTLTTAGAESTEHVLAVVEPTKEGERALDLAADVVKRGGRATVVVFFDNEHLNHISEFAKSEQLNLLEAEGIYGSRLVESYAAQVGNDGTETVLDRLPRSGRAVIDQAVGLGATMIALPASLANRRGWMRAIGRSPVSVTIIPPAAA